MTELTVISDAGSVVRTGTVGSFLQLLSKTIAENKKSESTEFKILTFPETIFDAGNQPFSEVDILLQIH